MLPDPIHPALVHFPIVLAVLLPLFAWGSLWVIQTGVPAQNVWALVVGLHLLMALSAWASVQTGKAQEDRVERVVAERHIEEHEEAGERLLVMAAAAFAVAAVGLARGRIGPYGRLLGAISTLVLLLAAGQTGASGGALVYEHGAASAYTTSVPPAMADDGEDDGE